MAKAVFHNELQHKYNLLACLKVKTLFHGKFLLNFDLLLVSKKKIKNISVFFSKFSVVPFTLSLLSTTLDIVSYMILPREVS